MKKILFLFLVITGTGLFTACSDDNNDVDDDNKTYVRRDTVDELGIIQNNLVRLNEKGEVDEYVLGLPLDAADSTELTVGVESYNEAVQLFDNIFPDTTLISMDGTRATLTVDEGSALLTPADGTDGLLATAKFSIPGLKHVSKLRFIKNSAWPENATEKKIHTLGMVYPDKGWTGPCNYTIDTKFSEDEEYDYVCIKEYSNGQPGILLAFTPKKYDLPWRYHAEYGGNIPSEKMAKTISDVLRGNWDRWEKKFNGLLKKDTEYWIEEGSDWGWFQWRSWIILNTGEIDDYEMWVSEDYCYVMFYRPAGVKKSSL